MHVASNSYFGSLLGDCDLRIASEDLLWPSNWIIWPLIPSRWYISQNIPEIQTPPLLHPSDLASMSHWLPRRQARSLLKRFTKLLISICKIILLHLLVARVKLRYCHLRRDDHSSTSPIVFRLDFAATVRSIPWSVVRPTHPLPCRSLALLIPLLVFPPFSPLLFSPLTDIIYPPEVLEAN